MQQLAQLLKRLFFTMVLLLASSTLAISYTVQVIAISSETAALKIMNDLSGQGYSAYLVTVATPEGPVFRIRVGSFVNRSASAKFAEAMSGILDSIPAPALADGIPETLAPLEAELIDSFQPSHKLEVLPWQGEVAFRSQLKTAAEQAHYRIVDIIDFDAWQAIPQNDGSIIRVYSHYLWPEAWTILSEAERSLARSENLKLISEALGLSPTQLESFQFSPPGSRPYLVLVEKLTTASKTGQLLKAIGQPNSSSDQFGPRLIWFDQQEIPLIPITPLFEASPNSRNDRVFESREGWTAKADGLFIQITSSEPQKTWRAAAGYPLWARANWLIASYNQELLVYKFRKR